MTLAENLLCPRLQTSESTQENLFHGIVHLRCREDNRRNLFRCDLRFQHGQTSAHKQSQQRTGVILFSFHENRPVFTGLSQKSGHRSPFSVLSGLKGRLTGQPHRRTRSFAEHHGDIVSLLPLHSGKSHRFAGDPSGHGIDKAAAETRPLII